MKLQEDKSACLSATELYDLVLFKAQLGEPSLEILIFFSSFYPAKPALKSPKPALKWTKPAL